MKKRRLTRREKRSKRKKTIIISTLCLLFVMTAGYAAFQTNLSITAKGNIVERSRVIQSWSATSQEDFHNDYYRENIVSATFLDNADVPNNATESWDVSETKDKGVMAWVIPNTEDNNKYDLYIGAKDGVIANEDSSNLFRNFKGIITIDFKDNFDTNNVTSMSTMFAYCSNLTTVNVSCFKTNNVTSMNGMFGYCNNLTDLDVSNFDTSNVITMSQMFAQCKSLTSLDLSNFNTSKVTDMSYMIDYCENLSEVDVSNFDTSNVKYMQSMFGVSNLSIINLCSFNTNNVIDMRFMFTRSKNLKQIKVGTYWTTANADTTNMFSGSSISEVTTGQC